MGAGLKVYVHDFGSAVTHLRYVLLRFYDHHVHIERFSGEPLNGFYNREAYRDVRHKYSVHYIHMQIIGIA